MPLVACREREPDLRLDDVDRRALADGARRRARSPAPSQRGRGASAIRPGDPGPAFARRGGPASVRPWRMTEMSVVASMFPPERITATGPILHLAREHGGNTGGARAFDDELRPLEHEHDRLRDVGAPHFHPGFEPFVENRLGQRTRLLDGDPVRDSKASGGVFTPITRTPERLDCTARAMPAASPPPRRAPRPSPAPRAASASSRPIVPCPATTSGSSNACTYVAPVAFAWRSPASTASSKLSPVISTRAP